MEKRNFPLINLILFLLTLGTTFYSGYLIFEPLVKYGIVKSRFQGAIMYSLGLLAILGMHELGHKIISDIRGLKATLPYFIPAPPPLGTFGAVIRSKERVPDRNVLFDIGIAGPIAGFIILVPILILGLRLSVIIPLPASEPIPEDAVMLPKNLLILLIGYLLKIPKDSLILLHPLALTGWIGAIVTMLNLMPCSSLDGGHISFAIFGRKWHNWISIGAILVTFLVGYTAMGMLMLFMVLFFPYLPPEDSETPISWTRKLLSIFAFIIWLLCFTPINL